MIGQPAPHVSGLTHQNSKTLVFQVFRRAKKMTFSVLGMLTIQESPNSMKIAVFCVFYPTKGGYSELMR